MAGAEACQNLQKERYAVTDDTTISPLHQPGTVLDPLTEIAREGARRMLASALEAEVGAFLDELAGERLPDGRRRVVRHGHGPERGIQTGIGALAVRRPKVRDRAAGTEGKVRFTSRILPKWARRSTSLDALLPVLYLRGISTGDFQEALAAILGAGRAEPLAGRRHTAHGRVGGGVRPLAASRSLGPPLRLHLGRRGIPPGPDGARRGVHARRHRRDAGGEEGARRLPGRGAGKRAELARTPGRSQGTAASRRLPRSPSATAPWASGRRWTKSSPARGTRDAGCTRPPTC